MLAFGTSRPELDDRRREQDVVLALVKCRHDIFELCRRHLTGRTREGEIGHGLAQELRNVVEIGNTRRDVIGLAAAETLAPQRFLQNHRIERRDVGPDRQAVDRRRRNQRQFANARQSQLQRARDRRRRKRQHVHVVAHLLQALFVRDAEVLLFIDDEQAEARELDRFAEQRMRADDDIDCSGLETRLDLGELLWPRPCAKPVRSSAADPGSAR